MIRTANACAWLVALGGAAAAQNLEITTLAIEGDVVPGVGALTRIDGIAVNDRLDWLVEADTDNANADIDTVLLRNGVLYLQQGDALALPAGASISSFDALTLNDSLHSGWNFFLDGTSGTGDDSGIYFDATLVLQEGTISTSTVFGAGTPYVGFLETKINDLGVILVMASVDDPNLPSGVDRAMVQLLVDGSGTLLAENVLFKEGDVLPGQTSPITEFATGPHNFDFNDQGDVIFFADLADGNDVIYLNNAPLAQNGQLSPVPGVNWLTLGTPELSLNELGGHAYSGRLDTGSTTDDFAIVANGSVLVREGDSPTDVAPFVITSFGSGPVLINDAGQVLWYGDWNDPDTTKDKGLFLDDELIVQEGVTTVGGVVIDTLRGIQDGYAMSRNGRYIVFEAILVDGREGAFLITEEAAITALPGCFGNAGVLAATSGDGGIGARIDFEVDNGQVDPSFPALSFSISPPPGFPPCGLFLPGIGEVLVGFLPPDPVLTLFGGLWTGAPVPFNLFVPADPSLVGVRLYSQGLLFDFTGATAEPFRMTNGLEIVLGL